MNSDNKEIIEAITELKSEVAVLKKENEHLSGYIYKELKVEIDKLCKRVEKCMDKSADERHRDLKWAIALSLTFCSSLVGWMLVFVKV